MSDPMNPTPPPSSPPSSSTPPAHPTPPPAQTIPPSSPPSSSDQLKTLNDNLVKAGSSVALVIAQAAKDQLGLDPVALMTPPKPKDDTPPSTAPAQGTGTHAPTTTGGKQGAPDTTPEGGSATPPGV